ncbi:MAG: Gfo/Idh/MocA family oxidoreductase [Pseudomonadota bacterium]
MPSVGLIGARIGAEHMAAYRALPELYDVRWVCDLDTARAERIAGSARTSTEISEVLSDPAVDIVDICLPPGLHLPVILDGLAAGKHVVCEKPLVTRLADIATVQDAEARAGCRVFPIFQYRYGPATAALAALARADLLGTPLVASVETHWDRGPDYYVTPWRGTWAGEQGGAILTHAIHIHDFLARAFGPVASVFARLGTRANPIEVEDCAALSLQMTSGALATSSVTLGAATDTTRVRLVWSGLTATSDTLPYAPAAGAWTFIARDPARQSDVDATIAAIPPAPSGFAGQFSAIAAALRGDAADLVTLEDARASLEFVAAAYASHRSGLPVALPLPADHPFQQDWRPASSSG